MTTTKIVDNFDLLDALETQTYSATGFDIVPENGEQVVTLVPSKPGSKYPFECKLYNPRRNDSRKVWNERKGEYTYALWDDQQAPDAIVKPACIQLFFQRPDGGRFTAYLANYVDKQGNTAWNKFVDAICNQTSGETCGMNITQTLAYLTKHPFKVFVYDNPKFKDKQVCYSEHDYNYWVQLALEREHREKAAERRAEAARKRKASKELNEAAQKNGAGKDLPWA